MDFMKDVNQGRSTFNGPFVTDPFRINHLEVVDKCNPIATKCTTRAHGPIVLYTNVEPLSAIEMVSGPTADLSEWHAFDFRISFCLLIFKDRHEFVWCRTRLMTRERTLHEKNRVHTLVAKLDIPKVEEGKEDWGKRGGILSR